MHRSLTRTLAGGLALALLFTACGDDGDDEDADDTTTTEAADESTTTAAEETTTTAGEAPSTGDDADDAAEARAEAISLTIDDFADGWTAEESSDDDDNGIDDCFVETPIDDVTVDEVETPTFSLVDAASGSPAQIVSMQTVVFDSPESAEAVSAEAQGEAFVSCATDALLSSLPAGAQAALEVQVDDPALAEESFGLAGALAVPVEDGTQTQGLLDLHLFRSADVVAFTITLDLLGSETFTSTLGELYQVVSDRLAEDAG